MKRSIAAVLALAMLLTLFSVSAYAAEYATITGGWLRLRSSPSYDSQTLASYYTGTQVEVLDTTGEWSRVRMSDGSEGYMLTRYLKATSGTQTAPGTGYTAAPRPEETPNGTKATVVSSNGYGVRMRSGPGTGYPVICKFPVGTAASILDSGASWCKVSVGSQTGYIMSQYLSVESNTGSGNAGSDSNAPVTYVGDATIWSGNGYGVRLRSGPGTEYDPIGVYGVGTKVKIISRGAVWDHVQVGSRRGYMMNDFLLYNDHYSVTGVTTNNLNPVVGNILAVQSVTPSTATVTYEWLVKSPDGKETVKGTTAAYTVTDADVGSTIRLRITGTGSYRGSVTGKATSPVVRTGTVESLTLNTLNPHVGDVLQPVIVPEGATVSYSWSVNGANRGSGSSYTVSAADAGYTITLKVEGKAPFGGSASVTTKPVLTLNAPLVETSGLPNGQYRVQYRHPLTAIGGGVCRWSITKGALPVGLSMDQNGVISGTPTECGVKTFTVQVTNEAGSSSKELIMTINKAMVSLHAIDGVVPPAKGGTPVIAVTATDQYTGSVTWNPVPANGVFDASTTYTAQINLTAKPNYTFTGLTPSFFSVSGSTGVSCTIGSDGSSVTVTAPFPATAAAGAVKLDKPVINGIEKRTDGWVISWTAVENATGYMLRICNQEWISCSANSYTLSGVPASGTYQVFAVGDNVNHGDSDTSDFVFILPVATPLSAPEELRIEATGNTWQLCWNPVANAVSYSICLPGSTEFLSVGTDTSYPLATKPQAGELYQVLATGDGIGYTDSAAASLTYTAPVSKLAVPAGFEILEKDGAWVAVWESVTNASGYRLENPEGNSYPCSETSYTFTAEPLEGYYYVTALGDGVSYLDSEAAYFDHSTAAALPLPAPKNLHINEKDGVWTAEWDRVLYAEGYYFRRSGEAWVPCQTNSYTFPGVPAEGEYAVYAIGDGTFFLDSPETLLDCTGGLPAAPSEASVDAEGQPAADEPAASGAAVSEIGQANAEE
ncbi:MAG: SH3 domain-containing protein [Clostridia bacterium]|nr:SH3 domain-containing protein [Clostridia bacterium]